MFTLFNPILRLDVSVSISVSFFNNNKRKVSLSNIFNFLSSYFHVLLPLSSFMIKVSFQFISPSLDLGPEEDETNLNRECIV